MEGAAFPSRFRLHLSTLVVLFLVAGALLGICIYLYQTIPRDQNGNLCDTTAVEGFYGALILSLLILSVTAVVCELWISLRTVRREAQALAEDLKRDRSDS